MEDFSFFTILDYPKIIAYFYLHIGPWDAIFMYSPKESSQPTGLEIK
ncbi:MAG: hypothetical protein PHI70_09670 [Proteiniphilum sp.]|nr:hypothetical protein [Proteiniphilum sp.]